MDYQKPYGHYSDTSIDPDPFSTISLIISAIGTAAGVASFIWQLKDRKRNDGTASLQQKNLVFELMERFEAKLVNLKSVATDASTLIKKSVEQESILKDVGFGYSQVSSVVNGDLLDSRYKIATDIIGICRELVDLEIKLLRQIRDLKFEFDTETLDKCEQFRLILSRITVGALSFEKALEEVINAVELGKNFINKLQAEIARE